MFCLFIWVLCKWVLSGSFVVSNCEFFYFPIGILGQVCYLIVSFPDLCTFTLLSFLFKQYLSVFMNVIDNVVILKKIFIRYVV